MNNMDKIKFPLGRLDYHRTALRTISDGSTDGSNSIESVRLGGGGGEEPAVAEFSVSSLSPSTQTTALEDPALHGFKPASAVAPKSADLATEYAGINSITTTVATAAGNWRDYLSAPQNLPTKDAPSQSAEPTTVPLGEWKV
ncbi:unnamed protein product, partial [Dibothriocephalus latus]